MWKVILIGVVVVVGLVHATYGQGNFFYKSWKLFFAAKHNEKKNDIVISNLIIIYQKIIYIYSIYGTHLSSDFNDETWIIGMHAQKYEQ